MHLTESMEVGTKQRKLTGRFTQSFWKLPDIYCAVSFPNFPEIICLASVEPVVGLKCMLGDFFG